MSKSIDNPAVRQTSSPAPLSAKQRVAQAGTISSAGFLVSLMTLFVYYLFKPGEFSGGTITIFLGAVLIGLIWLVAFSFHSKPEPLRQFFFWIIGIGIVLIAGLAIFVNSKSAGPWARFTQILMVFPILWVLGSYILRLFRKR